MKKFSKPTIITIPKIADPRGNLSVIQQNDTVPFPIARVFYLYDVPADSSRGGHAHHRDNQFMIAMAGSFDVVLDNGRVSGFDTPENLMRNNPIYQEVALSQQGAGDFDEAAMKDPKGGEQ